MRRIIKTLTALIFLISLNFTAFSQTAPPPPPPHGGDGAVGGSAPIGGGTLILVSLGAGYLLIKLRANNGQKE